MRINILLFYYRWMLSPLLKEQLIKELLYDNNNKLDLG